MLPSIDYFVRELHLKTRNSHGFKAAFNATYPVKSGNPCGWVSPWHYGLNQGPIVLMIENYRSELLWRLTRQCPTSSAACGERGFAEGGFKSPRMRAVLRAAYRTDQGL